MNALVVKALCRRIEARYGSNRAAAIAAGVSGGVWSNYCSDDHPDTTIPFHRLMTMANAAERQAFADLLTGEDVPTPADLMSEAYETTESAAELQRITRQASLDGKITPLERRQIREKAIEVQAQAADVLKAVG